MYLKSFCKLYKKIDIFGAQKHWRIFKEENYRTKISATLSIVLFSILLMKIIMLILNIANKQKYSVNLSQVINENKSLNISSLRLGICLLNKNEFYPISDYYSFQAFYLSIDGLNYSIEYIESGVSCSSSKNIDISFIDQFSYANSIYQNCFCVTANNNDSLTSDGKMNFSKSLVITLKSKLNESLFNSISGLSLYMYYTDFYMDYENSKYNPLVKYNNLDISPSLGAKTYYLDEIGYTDSSFNYFDLYTFKGNPQFRHHFSPQISASSQVDPENIGFTFQFKCSKLKIFYNIDLFTLDDLITVFGGNFQLFYLIFQILGSIYNYYHLEKKIYKKIKKESINYSEYYQGINQQKKNGKIPEMNNQEYSSPLNNPHHEVIVLKTNKDKMINEMDLDISNSKQSNPINKNENDIIVRNNFVNFKKKDVEINNIDINSQINNVWSNLNIGLNSKELKKVSDYFYGTLLTYDNFINLMVDVQMLKGIIFKDEIDNPEIQFFSKASCYFTKNIKSSQAKQREEKDKIKNLNINIKNIFKAYLREKIIIN
jgi:hypothetical protein